MGARTIHIEYTKGSILGNVRMVHYGWSASSEILAMSQPGIRRLTDGVACLGSGLGAGLGAGPGADLGAGFGAGLDVGFGAGLGAGFVAGLGGGGDSGISLCPS